MIKPLLKDILNNITPPDIDIVDQKSVIVAKKTIDNINLNIGKYIVKQYITNNSTIDYYMQFYDDNKKNKYIIKIDKEKRLIPYKIYGFDINISELLHGNSKDNIDLKFKLATELNRLLKNIDNTDNFKTIEYNDDFVILRDDEIKDLYIIATIRKRINDKINANEMQEYIDVKLINEKLFIASSLKFNESSNELNIIIGITHDLLYTLLHKIVILDRI